MRGSVLGYNAATGEGMLSGSNGERYAFAGTEWRGEIAGVSNGMEVDFAVADDSRARDVYPIALAVAPNRSTAGTGAADYPKSNIAAGLLALFLGPWGIHKFYLGYTGAGLTLLVVTILSFVLSIIGIGLIGLMIVGIISLVEAIIYLTKSPADFNATYVERQRSWF